MNEDRPVLDDRRRIASPPLHDAEVTSLSLDQRDCVIGVTHLDGARLTLRLVGLAVFRATQFEERNVILEVAVFRQPIPSPIMEELWAAAPDLRRRRAVVEKIENGDLCLVQMSSSVGCNFIAACEQVLWTGALD